MARRSLIRRLHWRTLAFAVLALTACSEKQDTNAGQLAGDRRDSLTTGEERARIAPLGEPAAVLRSGPQVPVRLPHGFTLYPSAKVLSSTVVERDGKRRSLVVFQSDHTPETIIAFYRGQARKAGVALPLDIGGEDTASLGGSFTDGGAFSVSVRRVDGATRGELAID